MPDTAQIRLALIPDLDAVAALAISVAGGDHADWVRRLRADLDNPSSRALWVADAGGEVVGYGRVHHFPYSDLTPDEAAAHQAPEGWYLIGLAVAPDHRRRRIGRAITQARLDWIEARATQAWYFTNARNEASLRLHHDLGFQEVTRQFSYPGVTFDGGVGILCSVRLPREAAAVRGGA